MSLEPASARALGGFERLQSAALRAALGWDAAKAEATPQDMAARRARNFSPPRSERGDVYIAGKTEEHEPGGVSLGLIFTEIDRAFVIVAPENSGAMPEFRFHHLERRRLDQALPDLLEAALAEGERVVVQAASRRAGRRAQRAAVDLSRR